MKKITFLICLILVFSSVSVSNGFASGFDKNPSDIDLKLRALEIEAEDSHNSINLDEAEISINILVDNNSERVVESIQDGVKSVATFNKSSNVLTTKVDGQEEVVYNLNELAEKELQLKAEGEMNSLAAVSKENTWSNFEYTINHASPNKWELRRPDGNSLVNTLYITRTETSSNRSSLNAFRSQVNALNDYEAKFIGAVTGVGILSVAALVVASLNGGAGVAVGLVAMGVLGAAYNAGIAMERSAKNALFYYWQV